jgi:dTDP-4-dehydrorhamnose reductase
MKILLVGKDGQVGWELQRSLALLGEVTAVGRAEADLTIPDSLRTLVRQIDPDIIVNAAAYTAVDKAESDAGTAYLVNAEAVGVLADEAARADAWLVHYSTDYVFDGEKSTPYQEDDATGPLSVYGKSKLAGEEQIRQRHAKHLIFRTSWVFAARGGNFAKTMLRLAKERNELKVVADQFGAPTSAELIADATALALQKIVQASDGGHALAGTYHLTASGQTSWHQYAQYVIGLAHTTGVALSTAPESVIAIPATSYPVPAPRPRNSCMSTEKFRQAFGLQLPDWRYHVQRLVAELTS